MSPRNRPRPLHTASTYPRRVPSSTRLAPHFTQRGAELHEARASLHSAGCRAPRGSRLTSLSGCRAPRGSRLTSLSGVPSSTRLAPHFTQRGARLTRLAPHSPDVARRLGSLETLANREPCFAAENALKREPQTSKPGGVATSERPSKYQTATTMCPARSCDHAPRLDATLDRS
jgi:hypothetical protein